MLRNQHAEADRLIAQILPDQGVTTGSFVPFIEQQIDCLKHGIQSGSKVFTGRNLEWNSQFFDALFSSGKALGNGGFGGEKSFRDFGGTESAKGFECECGL